MTALNIGNAQRIDVEGMRRARPWVRFVYTRDNNAIRVEVSLRPATARELARLLDQAANDAEAP